MGIEDGKKGSKVIIKVKDNAKIPELGGDYSHFWNKVKERFATYILPNMMTVEGGLACWGKWQDYMKEIFDEFAQRRKNDKQNSSKLHDAKFLYEKFGSKI